MICQLVMIASNFLAYFILCGLLMERALPCEVARLNLFAQERH